MTFDDNDADFCKSARSSPPRSSQVSGGLETAITTYWRIPMRHFHETADCVCFGNKDVANPISGTTSTTTPSVIPVSSGIKYHNLLSQ